MESKETRVTSGTKMSFYGTYLLDAAKREPERRLLLYRCLFDFLLSSKPNQDDRTRPHTHGHTNHKALFASMLHVHTHSHSNHKTLCIDTVLSHTATLITKYFVHSLLH